MRPWGARVVAYIAGAEPELLVYIPKPGAAASVRVAPASGRGPDALPPCQWLQRCVRRIGALARA
eukprot:1343726-Lingulodinium_polyedra.AAC.1